MDSDMRENLIGVMKPMDSETATQRWRKLCSLVKNRKRSFRLTAKLSMRYEEQEAAAAIRRTHQEKFRVAILISHAAFQFINGIDGLDVYSQDKEQTERPEEVNNIGSSYYCHQCDQVVTVTVGVDITCPLCQGCFMEEYGGVSSLNHAMPSESDPSSIDGHGTRVIPPNQTVLDIVDNMNGSVLNRSPLHSIGSHDYNSYGQTHQSPFQGHDDSNPIRSLSLSIGSDDAVTNNSVPGYVDPYESSLERGLLSLSIGTNIVTDQPHHETRVTTSVWIFSVTSFGFEAVSAFFDQVSSPRKPHYALYGMLLSIVAVVVCILDLIRNAMKQKGVASVRKLLIRYYNY